MAQKGFPKAMKAAATKNSTTVAGPMKKIAFQAPAAAADVAALKVQFDALLTKLVASGHMAAS